MELKIQPDCKSNLLKSNDGLNYLLIAPRISLLPYPQNLKVGIPLIPLGLAYVSSCIKAIYPKVYNLNLELSAMEVFDAVSDAIEKYKIDVVMTGGLSFQFTRIKEIIDAVKFINPNIPVVLGGGVVTSAPKIAMEAFERADIGVIGEGEVTACELVKALNGGEGLTGIEGLIYKTRKGFALTHPREEIEDLDSIPFPDYEGMGFAEIWNKNITKTAMIVGSRSCPFRCSFCFHPTGKKYRERSIDNIMREIEFLVEKYHIKSLGFLEELFVSRQKRVKEFCSKLKPYDLKWAATAHASTFKSDMLPLMKESGCQQISFGIESASDKVLKSMNKATTFSQIENALKKTYDNDLRAQGNFIFGDIAEDMETLEETLSWWRKNRQYYIDLVRVSAFPGSAIYNYAVQKGLIKNEVEFIKSNCPYINISKLSDKQYKEMSLRLITEEAMSSSSSKSFDILAVDIHRNKTFLKYECRCGYEAEVWTAGLLLSENIYCPECNQRYRLPLHEKYSMNILRDKVNALIKEKGKIAFWGLGREMQVFLLKSGLASLEDVLIIDRDPHKQNICFMDKRICAPDILKTQNVGILVPTPILSVGLHYMESIEEEVSKLNSQVEALNFGDLLKQEGFKYIDSKAKKDG